MHGQRGPSILCREGFGLEFGLGLRLGFGSGSAFVVYVEGLYSDSKGFFEVCIEGSLRYIHKLFEACRDDLQRSIVIRMGFQTSILCIQ